MAKPRKPGPGSPGRKAVDRSPSRKRPAGAAKAMEIAMRHEERLVGWIPGKVRLTVLLPRALDERIRNAVHGIPGLTASKLAEAALTAAVAALEEERGGRFPPRPREERKKRNP